jgi:hypothetical protein
VALWQHGHLIDLANDEKLTTERKAGAKHESDANQKLRLSSHGL